MPHQQRMHQVIQMKPAHVLEVSLPNVVHAQFVIVFIQNYFVVVEV